MKRKINYFLFSILAILMLVPNVSAKLTDRFLGEDSISISEKQDGSIFAGGNKVGINADIEGMTFAAGNSISAKGNTDYAFIAGNSITLDNYTSRDTFVAGNTIVLNDVNFKRDSYIAGSNINIKGNFGRSTYIGGATINISGVFAGGLTIEGSNITIEEGTVINGTLKYNDDAKITIGNNVIYKDKKTYANPKIEKKEFVKATVVARVVSKILSLVNLLIVGLVLILILPPFFKRIDKIDTNGGAVLKSSAIGLLTLICVPFVSIILMISVIGLSLGLISMIIYSILLYLSIIFAGYYIARLMMGPKTNKYLVMFVGVLCISVLKLIPIIGGFVTFITLVIGLGVFYSALFYKKR